MVYAIYISLTGYFMYFYTCLIDCILLAIGRNNTANIIGCTTARKIFTIYYDIGLVVCLDNCVCAKHTF